MSTPVDPATADDETAACPKCGARYVLAQDTCPNCGIVFAKWFARQAGESPAGRSDAGHGLSTRDAARSGMGAKHGLVVLALLACSAAAGWYFLAPQARGEDVIITFENGSQCHLANWKFRYTRRYSQTSGRGNILIVGRTQTESRFDGTLRVFDPFGEKLAIARKQLLAIELAVQADADNSFKFRVVALTLSTRDSKHLFEAHEIPRYSRTRVLVPDAAHYYPQHFDDDYMGWANGAVYLVGDAQPECGGNDSFNLTGDEYRKPWTPVHFDFPG